ncbi:MAG: glycosyltransferase [Patescibacteria group bacterium]
MKIIYFGSIDKNFTNNQIFWRGFTQNQVDIVDLVVNTPITPLNYVEDTNVRSLIKRVINKFAVLPLVFKKWHDMKGANAVFVGYPGHFDIPLAYIVSRILGIPLVFYPVLILSVTFRDDIKLFTGPSWKLIFLTQFERMMYRLCDLIIADGPFQLNTFNTEFGVPSKKLHYVYTGANDALYQYAPINDLKSPFNVVYYGMYTPLHGVEYILKAAKILINHPKIVFQMVGNGKIYKEMRQLAKDLQVVNVQFYPGIRESQAKPLLAKAWVFLGLFADSPSVKRQIANKVFQGMAMGKTVITADTPIIRTALKPNKNVSLVPAASPQALANAILKLQQNRYLAQSIGKVARLTFEQEFTPKIVTGKIIQIIKAYNTNKRFASS